MFAKTFSASSYSNECSKETARLNLLFTFSEQDVSNPTSPNSLSGGPQDMRLPRFNPMSLTLFLSPFLHVMLNNAAQNNNTVIILESMFTTFQLLSISCHPSNGLTVAQFGL